MMEELKLTIFQKLIWELKKVKNKTEVKNTSQKNLSNYKDI